MCIRDSACTVDIDEEQDKILRIRPLHFDEHYTPEEMNAWKIEARGKTFEPGFKTLISPLSLAYKKRVYSKNRIPYPMRREDWDPHGERHPETRGTSGYVRITWDEACDLIAEEIKRVHDAYGPASILCELDGHGETKFVHAPHGCQSRMFDLIGSYTLQTLSLIHIYRGQEPGRGLGARGRRAVGGACGGRAAGQPRHRIARGARRGHRLRVRPLADRQDHRFRDGARRCAVKGEGALCGDATSSLIPVATCRSR